MDNYFLIFFITRNYVPYFWMTQEDLDKCKKRFPVVWIDLTPEQQEQVEKDSKWNAVIKIELLTDSQKRQVEELLALDAALGSPKAYIML